MVRYCILFCILLCSTYARDVYLPKNMSSVDTNTQYKTRLTARSSHDRWFSQDKFLHFSASAAISGFAYLSLHRINGDMHRQRAYSVSITALIGIGKELYDKKKENHFSWKDLVWDGLGIGVGYLVFVR